MPSVARWEFFVNRWVKLYDFVTGTTQALKDVAPLISKEEAARMHVLVKKAARAKEVLLKLEDFEVQQAKLRAKYAPLLSQLPAAQQQVQPEELQQMHLFAVRTGLGGALAAMVGQGGGSKANADPFGIKLGVTQGVSAPLSLQAYLSRMNKLAANKLLSSPSLEQLARYNAERRQLVAEMLSLQRRLEGEVELPGLQPLLDDCSKLEAFLQAVRGVQLAHLAMLRRDLSGLDLHLLELRLKLVLGGQYKGSEVQQAMERLQELCWQLEGCLRSQEEQQERLQERQEQQGEQQQEQQGGVPAQQQQEQQVAWEGQSGGQDVAQHGLHHTALHALSAQEWREFEGCLQQLARGLQGDLGSGAAAEVEISIQSYERELYSKLAQLPSATAQAKQRSGLS